MWEYEYSMETSAGAGELWRHWADMAAWPRWNDGIETIEPSRLFFPGDHACHAARLSSLSAVA